MMPTTPNGAHLAQLQAVRERRAADHLADRVGQARDVTEAVGHPRHSCLVEAEPVHEGLGGVLLARRRHVTGVGLQHVGARRHQRVGHGVQRGVLGRPGRHGQLVGRLPGVAGHRLEAHGDQGRT
jgi:hypothetical protein